MKLPAALTLSIVLCTISFSVAQDAAPIELIAVAANTNRSSGGHSALRIGDRVYQYQVANEKMLFLQRDPWSFFERRYRQLDNRSLTLVRLDLSENDSLRINSRFNRLLVVQKKHLSRWEALKIEQLWFDDLMDGKPTVLIPFVGCFDSSSRNDENIQQLRLLFEKTAGGNFIGSELKRLTGLLNGYALKASRCGQNEIKIDAYPSVFEITAEQRLEHLTLREALIILKQGRAVSPTMLIAPDESALSENDRLQLKQLNNSIEHSVVRLLRSPRPDRGEALLLNIARYSAIQRSLEENRLLLLNAFPSDDKTTALLTASETQRHRLLLSELTDQAGEIWKEERQRFLTAKESLTEYGYQRLENAAARYIEPRNAIRDDRALRTCAPGFMRPDRNGATTPLEIDPPSAQALLSAQMQANQAYANFLADLHRAYRYSLFNHNCTTELAHAIQSTFSGPQEIRKSLGDVINPKRGLSIIPAEFTRQVARRWKIVDTRVLPSHRQQKSAELIAQDSNPWTVLRESNRWTSRAYPGSVHDDAFLFFSDGAPLWRPVKGTANLLYGLSNTGLGIATAPTTDGRLRVKRGLNGMFYSVPEIIGISIRKGRYDILPRDQSSEEITDSE